MSFSRTSFCPASPIDARVPNWYGDSLADTVQLPPRMLGRYALYEKIASGGMASVHIGRLLGPVGFARTVAIKRMHPQFAADPEFVSMFLDEARLAARIRHPNVVPTLEVVATAGELFLVMEFVQGESLSHLIRGAAARGERIPQDVVTGIVIGALQGLHAAHEAKSELGEPLNIVHRDVTPQNILVGTDGVARILDFGVAKAIGRHQTTQGGQLKGKLSYMSPEQISGSVSRVTDVYAAAVVLWEALAGKPLFRTENGAQTIQLILTGCKVPPSVHAPGVPKALDDAVMRGLRLDPGARFQTAREMARELESALAPALPSRIGDWVEAAAKDSLNRRNATIASIESDSSLQPAPPPSVPAIRLASTPTIPASDLHTAIADPVAIEQPAGRSSRRAGPWVAAAAGGVALLAAVALSSLRHSKSANSADSVTTSLAAAPVVTAPATAARDHVEAHDSLVASAPALSETPAPSATTSAMTVGKPNKAPTLLARPQSALATAGLRSRSAAPATSPAAPACSVVVKYDADGEPRFQKVCK
ncbi:MAG TPA: serine/threonine-protein kinase [Polyangiaceae bacterium]|nr:serine/threonine-protein kinase [Polyangiaceae bacterium]